MCRIILFLHDKYHPEDQFWTGVKSILTKLNSGIHCRVRAHHTLGRGASLSHVWAYVLHLYFIRRITDFLRILLHSTVLLDLLQISGVENISKLDGVTASDLYGVTTTATTRYTVHGERFGMDSTQVVTKRKTLSLEVPCDDYSQMMLVRHETLENICGRQNVPARAAFEACPWPVKR